MRYYSQLDFRSGFWQIPLDDESKELTAFRTEDGLFHFKRMPFGLTNAPSSFQKMMNILLSGLKGLNLQVFIDDICVATKTWEEHVPSLEKLFRLIINANLKLNPNKCLFGTDELTFLGHLISDKGIQQDPDKIRALDKLPTPRDASEVKRVLGLLSYYRKLVHRFAMIAEPLIRLTRKGVKFEWQEEHDKAFRELISSL